MLAKLSALAAVSGVLTAAKFMPSTPAEALAAFAIMFALVSVAFLACSVFAETLRVVLGDEED